MKNFCLRKFLNIASSDFTGSVVAFHGKGRWQSDEVITFLEIADCHNKVRLHNSNTETIAVFVRKLKLLRTVLNQFINYLEGIEDENRN